MQSEAIVESEYFPPSTAEKDRAHPASGQTRSKRGRRRNDVARALGWFSIGLGVAELVAPRALARAIGLVPTAEGAARGLPQELWRLRLSGVREIGAGLGILSERHPVGWMWSRVIGDVLDLTFLRDAFLRPSADPQRLAVTTAAVAGVTAIDVVCSQRLTAALRDRTERPEDEVRVMGVLTVNRSPADCYAVWRDLEGLPRFMHHVRSVRQIDSRRSYWTAHAPGGAEIAWDAEITADHPGELLTWRAVDDAAIAHEGTVRFQAAPNGCGTVVRVKIMYRPAAGAFGRAGDNLLGKIPQQQLRADLRRFKQLLEIGEVVTTDGQPVGPARGSMVRALTDS